MFQSTLQIIQIVLAVLVIASILLQQQGSGLGSAFGGGDGNFYRSKRGLEKVLFYATIVFIALFVVSIALPLFIA
ncbi:MAG: preprotein translocase subunit SecG [Candidatus Berkelbacteria bacterium]|nr:preprotein translocase subunit SecG [Candidatus Berkelbacteria bacterium]